MGSYAPSMAGCNSPLSRGYGPAIIPKNLGAESGLFQTNLILAQRSAQLTHRSAHMRAVVKHPTLYPSSTNPLRALSNLSPSDSAPFWSHGVTKWDQDAKICKTIRFGLTPGEAFMAISLSQASMQCPLILPLTLCSGAWLAVPLATCCPSRGWSRDGAQNSTRGRTGGHGITVGCISPAMRKEQI